MILPTFAVDFVLACKVFGSLDAHIDHFARKHEWNTLQVEALRSWIPRLIEAEVLFSGEYLRRKCEALKVDVSERPPIQSIGFPTGGNRVALLQRAVTSFIENAERHARTVDFVIADSSTEKAHTAQNQACLAELAGRGRRRLFYIGPEEKHRFAERLAHETGCNSANIEFALFDPLGAGFTCGANRNALLLHGAGQMFSSVDDDVVCQLAVSPQSDAQLSSFSQCDPFVRRFFPNRAAAFAAASWRDIDYVAAHEEMLGRDLGDFFGASLAANELDLAHVGDDFLSRLEGPRARIRTTFTGHVGDPGMPTSVYYLYMEGEGRRALPHDEAEYQSVMKSRSVLTCVKNRAVGDGTVSPGMAMGFDHRALLPPFLPVLHAEDFTYGATVWQCCGDSIAGHLPLAVLHEPAPGKPVILPGDLTRERRAVSFEFAPVLRRIILFDFQPGEKAAAPERIGALGRYLAEHAALPAEDFIEYMRAETLQCESAKIAYFEEQLEKAHEAPEPWRRDVGHYLDHLREALTFDDFDIPFDMKTGRSSAESRALIQALMARYGALLQEWPHLVEGARNLRDRGYSLAREII